MKDTELHGGIFKEPTSVFATQEKEKNDNTDTQYVGEGYTIPQVVPNVSAAEVDNVSITDQLHAMLSVESEAYLVSSYEDSWVSREEISSVAAVIAEEIVIRMVQNLFSKDILEIHLYEDKSHGSPHGHVLRLVDGEGETVVEGVSDVWHNMPGTSEIDEFVSEIYQLVPTSFIYDKEENARIHVIPVERDLRTKHADNFPYADEAEDA